MDPDAPGPTSRLYQGNSGVPTPYQKFAFKLKKKKELQEKSPPVYGFKPLPRTQFLSDRPTIGILLRQLTLGYNSTEGLSPRSQKKKVTAHARLFSKQPNRTPLPARKKLFADKSPKEVPRSMAMWTEPTNENPESQKKSPGP